MFSIEFIKNNIGYILSAIPVTLNIVILSVFFASVLGGFYAWAIVRRVIGINILAEVLISLGRSTPVLVMLYFIFYVYPYIKISLFHEPLSHIAASKLAPDVAAILTLSLVFSAYFSEVFRSALNAVDKGQHEAGVVVGLSNLTCFRRIILPQAMKSGLPNYTNVVIDLIKDSSLVYSITVIDVMARANIAAARGFHFVESYVVVLFVYIALCFIFTRILRWLENRLSKKWYGNETKINVF